MNSKFHLSSTMAQENHGETQNDLIAYAAGLFDGEGCVVYKQYRVKKGCMKWHINLEIAMTELDCIHWFYNIVKTGTIHYKRIKGLEKNHNGVGDALIVKH